MIILRVRHNRMGERLNNVKLRSDRFFSERIMGKYARMKNRFPAMAQMVFGERASRSFAFKLKMLLSVPVQIMNRYSLLSTDVNASIHQASYAPAFNAIFSHVFSDALRQKFRSEQVVQHFPAAPSTVAAFLRLIYALTEVNAAKQVFNSNVNDYSAIFKSPLRATVERGRSENQIRNAGKTRPKRIFTHLVGQGILMKQLEMRRETRLFSPRSGTAVIHAISQQRRKSVTEKELELIFGNTDRIGREIDEMKRTLKKTEDRVQEKVAHQLRDIVSEQNRRVDIGQLTQQVYRNMERMIRSERERRGM